MRGGTRQAVHEAYGTVTQQPFVEPCKGVDERDLHNKFKDTALGGLKVAGMARWVVLALATALVALSAVVRADCPCRLQQNSTEHSLHHIFEASTYRSHGVLRDLCECGVESVQELNSAHVYPALDELRRTPFFRYFRVDLLAECPFWKEDGYCMIRDCAVGEEDEASESALSAIDRSRDHDTIHVSWPDELDDAWTNEDAEGQTHFINLMENPERYTGYKGASPHHIWNAVYQDNMFYLPRNEDDVHGVEAMKVEHRAFYKLVSGTHASISSHIAAQYLLNEDEVREKGPDVAIWGPDLDQCALHRRARLGSAGRASQQLVSLRSPGALRGAPAARQQPLLRLHGGAARRRRRGAVPAGLRLQHGPRGRRRRAAADGPPAGQPRRVAADHR